MNHKKRERIRQQARERREMQKLNLFKVLITKREVTFGILHCRDPAAAG